MTARSADREVPEAKVIVTRKQAAIYESIAFLVCPCFMTADDINPNPGRRSMDIRIDPRTLERAAERGASSEEIIDVITSGHPIPAKYRRFGKSKVFDFIRRAWAATMSRKKSKSFLLSKGML